MRDWEKDGPPDELAELFASERRAPDPSLARQRRVLQHVRLAVAAAAGVSAGAGGATMVAAAQGAAAAAGAGGLAGGSGTAMLGATGATGATAGAGATVIGAAGAAGAGAGAAVAGATGAGAVGTGLLTGAAIATASKPLLISVLVASVGMAAGVAVEKQAPSDDRAAIAAAHPSVGAPPRSGPLPPPTRASLKVPAPTITPPTAEPTRSTVGSDVRLADETDLLERAAVALGRGEAAEALALTGWHQRRFGNGALRQEREALAIQALAMAGEQTAARQRLADFRARYPGSIHLNALASLFEE